MTFARREATVFVKSILREMIRTVQAEYELISRDGAPKDAAMSMCVTDDCMAPYIAAGERVYICVNAAPAELEVGVFMYEGRVVCRQWCEDYSGALHLLAANPARRSESITVPADKRDRVVCLGRVLMRQKLPAPIYY